MPTGPTVQVMPAPGKPFDIFVGEDQTCRAYASQAIAGGRTSSANSQLGTAAAATALGAVAGALIGNSGESAATGAGIGLIAGSAVGAGQGSDSGYTLQRQYNIAYEQCMYAKGNIVPGQAIPSNNLRNLPPPPPPPPPAYRGEGD